MKPAARIAALLLGLALLALCLHGVDWPAVAGLLGQLGLLAPIVLLPYLCVYFVDCLAWRFSFPPTLTLPFPQLFRIRWCGESVNNTVPSGYVGGEAVKVYLLRQRGLPARIGTSAALVSKTAQSLAQLGFVLLGSLALLYVSQPHPGLQTGLLVVLAGGGLTLALLFWIQRRGVFASLLAAARRLHLRPRFIERHRAQLLEIDSTVIGFYRDHRPRFYAATGVFFAGWLLDSLEVFLFAWLLQLPISWPQALALEAFTGIAKVLGMWIPGSLGVQESGIVLLGRLAGLPPNLAVTYALFRRARELLFALVGWILLSTHHTSLQQIRRSTTSPLPNPNPHPSIPPCS